MLFILPNDNWGFFYNNYYYIYRLLYNDPLSNDQEAET